MIFSQVCINLSPALQGGGWAGGGEGRVGVGGWERGKTPQVKTRGHQLPPDGPDHSIRPKGHHPVKGRTPGWLHPNWHAPQVPMCRSWFYKVVNPPPRKADPLSLAMGDMLCK